ncbi:MAG TPA: S-layer homology domain-containing protein, partial [Clostridiaceae bacterium]|nr:S-layer homology domain-containing protein [Clostridiaceae bacterium]
MKGKYNLFISIILLITMIISSTVFALPEVKPLKPVLAEGVVFDGTQSSWAKEEIEKAFEYGLTYPDIMKNFNKEITREEFCTIVVKLYETLTGTEAEAGANPFSDTKNPEILKAYNLKIVYGTSADKFTPDKNITRQEICVMIYRALDVSISELDRSMPKDFDFADKGKIADWAIDAVKFAYKNNIMKGTGNNEISPLVNTTREQGIVLLKRTYEQYMDKDSQGLSKDGGPVSGGLINNLTVSPSGGVKFVFPSGDKVKDFTTEEKKFREVVPEENLAFL